MTEELFECQTVDELKELGNNAVRNQKYDEAILHYTHAVKRDPSNHTLYSNRSFAFLKLKHYFFALQDANETIRLNPAWAKGYFRKAEVEMATYHFIEACHSYEKALEYKPDDQNLMDALTKGRKNHLKDKKADEQIPWLGAGIGIVLGVIIVIADYLYTNKPTHPLLMAVVTIAIAMLGYGIARAFRYYVKCQRDSLLQGPPELVDDKEDEKVSTDKSDATNQRTSNVRYTKSQARQRYKKGKA